MWNAEEQWSDDESFGYIEKKRSKLDVLDTLKPQAWDITDELNFDEEMDFNDHFFNEEINKENKLAESRNISRSYSDTANKPLDEIPLLEPINTCLPKTNKLDDKLNFEVDQISKSNIYNIHFDFGDEFSFFGIMNKSTQGKKLAIYSKDSKILTIPPVDLNDNYEYFLFSGIRDQDIKFYLQSWPDSDTRKLDCITGSLNETNIEYDTQLDLDSVKITEDTTKLNLRTLIGCSYMKRIALNQKYKPKSCLDIINDEGAVRNILKWIKQWEGYVFGKKTRNLKLADMEDEVDSRNEDIKEAPNNPILLVGGPSGCGKTSLINILAKQCGYSTYKVRLDDERNSVRVENSIKIGIGFNTIQGVNSKPNLVLIDELDSSLLNSSPGNKYHNNDEQFKEQSPDCVSYLIKLLDQHKKTLDIIKRPVICLCSDIYNKSLRNLRLKVPNIILKTPKIEKVTKRLLYICEKENIELEDQDILTRLAIAHSGDIRSCLNSLELMIQKEKYDEHTNEVYLDWVDFDNCCYIKDIEQDASDYVKICIGLEDHQSQSIVKYVLKKGEECVANHGSNVAILLLENIYRCLVRNDLYFNYLASIIDNIVEYDVLGSRICSLLPFLNTCLTVAPRLQGIMANQFRYFGMTTYTYSQQVKKANKNILKDISLNSIPTFQIQILTCCFVVDILPFIVAMLYSNVEPNYSRYWYSPQLISKFRNYLNHQNNDIQDEQETLAFKHLFHILTILFNLGLNYTQRSDTVEENIYIKNSNLTNYTLNPNIEQFFSFPCYQNAIKLGFMRDSCIPFTSIQMNASGFSYRYYCMINQLLELFADEICKNTSQSKYINEEVITQKERKSKAALSIPKQLSPKHLNYVNLPSPNKIIQQIREYTTPNKNYQITYKYNDGCTDAVKVDVYIGDFVDIRSYI
ncbi:hypothetical protein ACR3K2_18940 [Cryptosporidium serpentis]